MGRTRSESTFDQGERGSGGMGMKREMGRKKSRSTIAGGREAKGGVGKKRKIGRLEVGAR